MIEKVVTQCLDGGAAETWSIFEAMRRFRIGGEVFEDDAAAFQLALRDAHERKLRPLCLCREPGTAMYIARMGEQYLVKRMPLTGFEHDPACESFEPPYELSGLGALIGSAIQLDTATGMAALKLDFSLSKTGSRAAPVAAESGSDSVAGDARKLTLRGRRGGSANGIGGPFSGTWSRPLGT